MQLDPLQLVLEFTEGLAVDEKNVGEFLHHLLDGRLRDRADVGYAVPECFVCLIHLNTGPYDLPCFSHPFLTAPVDGEMATMILQLGILRGYCLEEFSCVAILHLYSTPFIYCLNFRHIFSATGLASLHICDTVVSQMINDDMKHGTSTNKNRITFALVTFIPIPMHTTAATIHASTNHIAQYSPTGNCAERYSQKFGSTHIITGMATVWIAAQRNV